MPIKPVAIALGLGLAALNCSAQIKITSHDLPVAGDHFRYTNVSDSVDVSKTGANFFWDFSHLTDISQSVAWYRHSGDINPDFGSTFPGAVGTRLPNPVPLSDDYYGFFKTSEWSYDQVGAGVTIPLWEKGISNQYHKPDRVYNLPLKYGDHDKCEFGGSVTWQELQLSTSGKRWTVVDGWGKVKTRYGTFDCIRVKSEVKQTDSVGNSAVDASRTEYRWLAKGERIPVFEVIIPGAGSIYASATRYKDIAKTIWDPDAPQVNFTVNDSTVETDEVVQLINKTPGEAIWKWSINPSTFKFVDNTFPFSRNPRVLFTAPGIYSINLQGTNANGTNSVTKNQYISVIQALAIGESGDPVFLHIYPSVTSASVRIDLPEGRTGQGSIQLTDFAGRRCLDRSVSMTGGTHTLDMSSLPAGMYFIRLQIGNEIFSGKVIRQ